MNEKKRTKNDIQAVVITGKRTVITMIMTITTTGMIMTCPQRKGTGFAEPARRFYKIKC